MLIAPPRAFVSVFGGAVVPEMVISAKASLMVCFSFSQDYGYWQIVIRNKLMHIRSCFY